MHYHSGHGARGARPRRLGSAGILDSGGHVIEVSDIFAGLEKGEDGVWYSPDAAAVSYPDTGHLDCFQVEEDSFWFAHRTACIEALIDRFPPPPQSTIADVGGGNGLVARAIEGMGHDVMLVEPGPVGARNARQRGVSHVVCATLESARPRMGMLGGVGLFDVIEHIEDDVGFLRTIAPLLAPEGLVYATVPAYSMLWSAEDIDAGHYRRYSLGGIRRVLEGAGLRVRFASYIFRPLPLPILALRAIPYRLGRSRRAAGSTMQSDHAMSASWRTRVLEALLAPELVNLREGRPMRFGGSCLLAASAA